MTVIIAKCFDDAEAWLKENLVDLSIDSVSAVRPGLRPSCFEEDQFSMMDTEEGTVKFLKLQDFVEALQLLCDQIGLTLFVGGLKSPVALIDPCNWDVEVTDAFYQLAYHKKVIYG